MAAEFIWFFGASGAGKASLINKVANGQLRIPGIDNPVLCQESLTFSRVQREQMLEEKLGGYIARGAPMLIKGQSTDLSTFRTPYHLREKYPLIPQKVVFVYTRPELLPQRTALRSDNYWPNPDHDFAGETTFQLTEVGTLCGFLATQPIVIDNSGPEPQVRQDARLIQ